MKSFNSAGTDYMFTGALAGSYYGTPRTTMDADVMVNASSVNQTLSKFVSALKKVEVQVDERKIDTALESDFKIATFRDSRSPFTLDTIFSEKKLNKRPGTILSLPIFYQTPEELTLTKLRRIKATIPRARALKDEEDVKAILRFTQVDVRIIKREARKNSTLPILEDIFTQTKS